MFFRSRLSIWPRVLLALFLLPFAQLAQADEAMDPEVKKVFSSNCSWCHGDYGRAAGKAPKLAGTRLTEKQVFDRISNGISGKMPAYKRTLSEAEIQSLAAFIKGLESE
jgi:mono/diheme cytochrome c family protein